jgi:hypothetical protein
MKKSEFIAKLNELFGEDDDVEIYFDSTGWSPTFTGDFRIYIDSDSDAVIKPF